MFIAQETSARIRNNRFSQLITATTILFFCLALLSVGVIILYGKGDTGNPQDSAKGVGYPEFAEMLTAEELAAQKGEVYVPPKQTAFPEDAVPIIDPKL